MSQGKISFKVILLIFVVVIFSAIAGISQNLKEENPEQFFYGAKNKILPQKPKRDHAIIQNLLDSEIKNYPGDFRIIVKDLKTDDQWELNADEKIRSASIYKLAVMYKTYDALEKGEVEEDEVREHLRLMITVSSNDSAIFLAEKFGWSNINEFLKTEGIEGFNLVIKDYPETTARAAATLLEKIYTGSAVSKRSSEEMKKLLFAQEINDRIPRYLPKEIEVAHKTGEIDNFRHDAGIVVGKKSDYLFVFLSETPQPQVGAENLAKLSKILFDELEKH